MEGSPWRILYPLWTINGTQQFILRAKCRTGAALVSTRLERRIVLGIAKGMSLFDRRTACVLLTIVLFAAAAGFIYGARRILIVFLFAVLFAYLLDPGLSHPTFP